MDYIFNNMRMKQQFDMKLYITTTTNYLKLLNKRKVKISNK